MVKSKPIKKISELIEIIESKGIIVENKEEAKQILQQISYQRLMTYRKNFINKNLEYQEETKFKDIFSLYNFDRSLKFLIYEIIEHLELFFRTRIAYIMGLNHGEHFYLDNQYFYSKKYHGVFLDQLEKIFNRHSHHPLYKNHKKKYSDELPIYKLLELTSFGTLSLFFKNIKFGYQDEIISIWKKKNYKIKNQTITSWLKTLTDVRNICAHHDLLWDKEFEMKALRNKYWKNGMYKRSQNKEIYSVYGVLLIFKSLVIDQNIYNDFLDRIESLFDKYKDILKYTEKGRFPDNWLKILENKSN